MQKPTTADQTPLLHVALGMGRPEKPKLQVASQTLPLAAPLQLPLGQAPLLNGVVMAGQAPDTARRWGQEIHA